VLVEPPARGVRVGGVTVAPGEARAVSIPLSPGPRRSKAAAPRPPRSIPAWVVVGLKPGPRVSVVGALRGVETTAALAASRLAAGLECAAKPHEYWPDGTPVAGDDAQSGDASSEDDHW